jgi:hypothetical protein
MGLKLADHQLSLTIIANSGAYDGCISSSMPSVRLLIVTCLLSTVFIQFPYISDSEFTVFKSMMLGNPQIWEQKWKNIPQLGHRGDL